MPPPRPRSYTLLMERLHVPGPKTLANPNGLYAFYVHFASPYLPHTRLVVEESCMYLVSWGKGEGGGS